MHGTLRLERDGAVVVVRLERSHGNAINPRMVDDLTEAFREIESDGSIRGVMLASTGKIFCPGLDLQELIELERETMTDFLERFRECIVTLYTCSRPVVAAMHGHAVAGGCVLGLTADWRVLAEDAKIGLAEVKVGVPFPYAVSLILREAVAPPHLEEVALFGRNYSGKDAAAVGLVHEVRPVEGFEQACRERLDQLCRRDPRALSITKRYLRSATMERIRAVGAGHNEEFLDAWFSDETRGRIRSIVDGLKARG